MDIKKLMQQAQEMQKKIEEVKEKSAKTEYRGSAGGGVVEAIINGCGMAKKFHIDKSLMQESEKEILEDLIVAAFNDAKKKADKDSKNSLKSITGGLPIPFI